MFITGSVGGGSVDFIVNTVLQLKKKMPGLNRADPLNTGSGPDQTTVSGQAVFLNLV